MHSRKPLRIRQGYSYNLVAKQRCRLLELQKDETALQFAAHGIARVPVEMGQHFRAYPQSVLVPVGLACLLGSGGG